MPKVTIGLPVFNAVDYLGTALESILAQTFADFELIISDIASTDASEQICRRYAGHDGRIRYVRQRTNLGDAATTTCWSSCRKALASNGRHTTTCSPRVFWPPAWTLPIASCCPDERRPRDRLARSGRRCLLQPRTRLNSAQGRYQAYLSRGHGRLDVGDPNRSVSPCGWLSRHFHPGRHFHYFGVEVGTPAAFLRGGGCSRHYQGGVWGYCSCDRSARRWPRRRRAATYRSAGSGEIGSEAAWTWIVKSLPDPRASA
jgi:glycosyltransferase involved in cell wall biosynthesis